MISEAKLRNIAADKGFNIIYLEKDYFLTILLYCMQDLEGISFKGGTALNKLFLNHKRLSEDLDFTAKIPLEKIKVALSEIIKKERVHFKKLEYENESPGFVRIKVFYNSHFTKDSFIIVDLNGKASIHLDSERMKVPNFYGLDFEANILNTKELFAEKLRAAITRNKPRDYFDLYFILKDFDVDIELVKKKVEEAGEKYDVERIFKNASKIYSRWNEDLENLTNVKLEYKECIKFLADKLRSRESSK